ncbi:MAG: hypothetical protein M3Y46_04160, partial [Actinomycetota bacterium]|nr:hypothetical protein [Actinomycetota bacterium]
IGHGERVRLIGVRAEQLRASGSGALLWDPDEEWRDAERTIDEVTAKFGKGTVRPAALVHRDGRARGTAAARPDDDDTADAAAGWGW